MVGLPVAEPERRSTGSDGDWSGYKVVDDGRLVHLSRHKHGDSEPLHAPRRNVGAQTARLKVSRPYMEHYERACGGTVAA